MNIPGIFRKLINDFPNAYTAFGDRVYPLHAPNAPTYPFVIATVVNINPATNKTHVSKVDNVTVQVDIYSTKYGENCAHAELVREAVDMWMGDVVFMGETIPVDGIHFDSGSQDFVDVQGSDGQMIIYRHVHNYVVRIKRGGDGSANSSLRYYVSDEAAIAAGLQAGDMYLYAPANLDGMPVGVPKVIEGGNTGMMSFVSDEAAMAGGMVAGQRYLYADANLDNMPIGVPKTIQN
jgi:hypothetical protein